MIGPLDLTFDFAVGQYLANSPSAADKYCLKGFFATLRQSGSSNYAVIGIGIVVFATCNHEILIYVRNNGGVLEGYVRELKYVPLSAQP